MISSKSRAPESSAPGSDQNNGRGRLGLWLFILAFCFFTLFTAGNAELGDGSPIFEVTYSMAEHAKINIGQASSDHLARFGVKPGYSYFGSGPSAAAVPFYLLGKLVARLIDSSAADRVSELFACLSACFYAALIVLLFYKLSRSLGTRPRAALLASLVLMAGTTLWYQSKTLSRELLAGLGVLLAIYSLHRCQRTRARFPLLMAGFGLLLAYWSRIDLLIAAPFLLIYLASGIWTGEATTGLRLRKLIQASGLFVLIPLLSIPFFLYFNQIKFGSPFSLGYTDTSMTATPLWLGLTGLLFSPMHGLFFYAPPLLLGLLAFPRLLKQDGQFAWLVIGVSLLLVVFFGKYTIWSGGYSIGPRFLLPIVPLLLLPLAKLIDSRDSKGLVSASIVAAALAGFVVQLICSLGSWFVFFARYNRFFGKDAPFHTPTSFVYSPLADFIEQIQFEGMDVAWFRMAQLGLPRMLYAIPLCCLLLAGLALIRLRPHLRGASLPPGFLKQLSGSQKIVLAALSVLALLGLGTVAAERLAYPRGLDLQIFTAASQVERPSLVLTGQPMFVDRFFNPLAIDPPAKAAVWEGFVRVPSLYIATTFFLATSDPCLVTIGDQVVFRTGNDRWEDTLGAEKQLNLKRGYFPIRVVFLASDKEPYFILHWTIQDFIFREQIGRQYLFAQEPGRSGKILIALEFYLLLLAGVAAFLGLSYFLDLARLQREHSDSRQFKG